MHAKMTTMFRIYDGVVPNYLREIFIFKFLRLYLQRYQDHHNHVLHWVNFILISFTQIRLIQTQYH